MTESQSYNRNYLPKTCTGWDPVLFHFWSTHTEGWARSMIPWLLRFWDSMMTSVYVWDLNITINFWHHSVPVAISVPSRRIWKQYNSRHPEFICWPAAWKMLVYNCPRTSGKFFGLCREHISAPRDFCKHVSLHWMSPLYLSPMWKNKHWAWKTTMQHSLQAKEQNFIMPSLTLNYADFSKAMSTCNGSQAASCPTYL